MRKFTLGTRGSALALRQAECVRRELRRATSGLDIAIQVISTSGDTTRNWEAGTGSERGIFTSEIEQALLHGTIDLAVHSLKDLPTVLPQGLIIGAVLKREDPRDVLISFTGSTFGGLRKGAAVGTASLRRTAQIRLARPDVSVVSLRGNIDTRINKVLSGDVDAIVVACAGVKRLGHEHLISEILSSEVMLPAPGQGAIAVEARHSDNTANELLNKIDHPASRTETTAERTFLHELHGGCHVPVGACASLREGCLVLQGLVALPDGTKKLTAELSGCPEKPDTLGKDLAQKMLRQGADMMLRSLSNRSPG